MTAVSPITKDFTIGNEYGLHARPAALFVKCCSKFQATVEVEKDGMAVSGKSIMGLLTLEGHQGSVLTVRAAGAQAADVMQALTELMDSNFGE
jgi:phosphotransferase system HPr (HPr) family protein